MKKLIFILGTIIALQGCGGFKLSDNGAGTAKKGITVFGKARIVKYESQKQMIKDLSVLHERAAKEAAIADMLPYELLVGLDNGSRAKIIEMHYQRLQMLDLGKVIADGIRAGTGALSPQAQAIQQAMLGTNATTIEAWKTVRKGFGLVGIGFGLREGRRAVEGILDRTAAKIIAKDGSTINYNNEQFDYRPTAKDGSTINGGDYKPNNAGGIPVNPADISDIALGEGGGEGSGSLAQQCTACGGTLAAGGRCSDGVGGTIQLPSCGLIPEPEPEEPEEPEEPIIPLASGIR